MSVREAGEEKIDIWPEVYVLTRTSGRPNCFSHNRASVLDQCYPGTIVHVVGTDDQADQYVEGDIIVRLNREETIAQGGSGPFERYMGEMYHFLDGDGWIISLDDDDAFATRYAVNRIVTSRQSDEDVLLWRTDINGRIVPDELFGHPPYFGHISSCGFSFHSKYRHLVMWDGDNGADYRAACQLYCHLRPRWVDEVLTKTQGSPGSWQRRDRRDHYVRVNGLQHEEAAGIGFMVEQKNKSSSVGPRKHVFMHVATINHWREIVEEQLDLMESSGLMAEVDSIDLCVVGEEKLELTSRYPKVRVKRVCNTLSAYEFPTLHHLWQCARSAHPTDQFLYIHTKGASFQRWRPVEDWRKFMAWTVIEQWESAIKALANNDACGANLARRPRFFAGNFWWANAGYLRSLPDPGTLEQSNRFLAERWIGQDEQAKLYELGNMKLNSYAEPFPRLRYAKDQLIQSNSAHQRKRTAIIFDAQKRRDTTGAYCYRALKRICDTDYFRPDQINDIPEGYDLYLNIDDGMSYDLPDRLKPMALWAIDTHLRPQRIFHRAEQADFIFAAQKEGATLLTKHLGYPVEWLPLACDPEVHAFQSGDSYECYDIGFIGNINSDRKRLLRMLLEKYPNSYVGRAYFRKMAKCIGQFKIGFNHSLNNDVNMRIFETMAAGSMLLTSDVYKAGLEELFEIGQELVIYHDESELIEKVEYYLKNKDVRENIAKAGKCAVLESHTYQHRMQRLLDVVDVGEAKRDHNRWSIRSASELTSIIILTHNQLGYTKLCLESIKRHTPEPIELIIIDNASTDGTTEYLRTLPDITLIENPINRSFAEGCNQGIRAARGENILLLNNDVVVTNCWLKQLLKALRCDVDVGMVGPVTNYTGGSQKVPIDYDDLALLDEFASSHRENYSGSASDSPVLFGFCLLIKRSVLDHIGLLDERYAIGMYEDNDISLRAIKAGYRLLVVHDVFVHHFGSQTFKARGIDLEKTLERNRQIFIEKWDREQIPLRSLKRMTSNKSCQPKSISLCMIARDNENTIRAALESISPWVDEMIVVDTGSKDKTPDIARECGARVEYYDWCDDFSKARNESLKYAKSEWIFWMDSDDVIDAANGKRMHDIIERHHNPAVLGYVAQVECPGSMAESGVPETSTLVDHVKLFRNLPDIRFSGRIHEQVLPSIRQLGGEVGWAEFRVVHAGSDQSEEILSNLVDG